MEPIKLIESMLELTVDSMIKRIESMPANLTNDEQVDYLTNNFTKKELEVMEMMQLIANIN